jgi:hypothetical protein
MQKRQQVNRGKAVCRASGRQRLVAAAVFLVILGVFAVLRPGATRYADLDRWFGPCGFKQQYQLPCPTCGITTAARSFVQGRIFESFYIQPAGALLCCALAVGAFFAFFCAATGLYFRFLVRIFSEIKIGLLILIAAIIIAAGWMVTLARALAAK